MRFLSKWNSTVRKFRDVSPGIAETIPTRRRTRFIGTRLVPLDALAKWMIWGSTALVIVLALLLKGPGSLPILVVGSPLALALCFLIASMVQSKNWDRVVALIYVLSMLLVLFMLPA